MTTLVAAQTTLLASQTTRAFLRASFRMVLYGCSGCFMAALGAIWLLWVLCVAVAVWLVLSMAVALGAECGGAECGGVAAVELVDTEMHPDPQGAQGHGALCGLLA